MDEKVKAVLVHSQPGPSNALKQVLDDLGILTLQVQSCGEASSALKGIDPAELIFTDTSFTDGTWLDVLQMAGQSQSYLPVIVMSDDVDVELYVKALDNGAFDFITPPFIHGDLARIVRSAVYQELVSKNMQSAPVV